MKKVRKIHGVTAAAAAGWPAYPVRDQVQLLRRPYAGSLLVRALIRGGAPQGLCEITRALTRELRQGVAPRRCAGWLALRDWIEQHSSAQCLDQFDEIDAKYGARTLKQALMLSGLSKRRPRPRPRP